MIIRELEEKDIQTYFDDISEHLRNCFVSSYEDIPTDEFLCGKIVQLKEYIGNHSAFVFGAIDKENLIGFLWGYPMTTPLSEVFHVAYISVKENMRGKGIGHKLISEAEQTAEKLGLKVIELITGEKNQSALHFYYETGYSVDRYVMRKHLGK